MRSLNVRITEVEIMVYMNEKFPAKKKRCGGTITADKPFQPKRVTDGKPFQPKRVTADPPEKKPSSPATVKQPEIGGTASSLMMMRMIVAPVNR
ncbi:hypothetical protein Hanom_Chr07g00674131 [Helianthus anomalus]